MYVEDLFNTFEEGQQAKKRLEDDLSRLSLDFGTHIGRINN